MKPLFHLSLLLALVLLAPSYAVAQQNYATLTGTVVDAETGTPMAGTHVFIAVSMIGTTTDGDGRFRLEPVPLGAHRLVVSMIGFDNAYQDILLREGRVYTYNFEIVETILEVGEIVVEAKEDKNWRKRLEKFTRLFIGETPNAMETKIINPLVLDFTEKLGRFDARASEPLIIENQALGYKVQYFLKDFVAEPTRTRYDGEPLYEEMQAENPEQAAIWEENRRKAFTGSFRHFLLALQADRIKPQGFQVFSRPALSGGPAGSGFQQSVMQGQQRYPVDPNDLFHAGEAPTEKILEFEGFVEIIYMGEKEDPAYLDWQQRLFKGKPKFQSSWINLERGPAVIDYKGDVLDPYGVTFYGYLAFERIGDELPKEYRPGR